MLIKLHLSALALIVGPPSAATVKRLLHGRRHGLDSGRGFYPPLPYIDNEGVISLLKTMSAFYPRKKGQMTIAVPL